MSALPKPRRYVGEPFWYTATLMPGTPVESSSCWTRSSTSVFSDQFGREEFCRQIPAYLVPAAVSYRSKETRR